MKKTMSSDENDSPVNFELFDRNKSPVVILDKLLSNFFHLGHHFLVVLNCNDGGCYFTYFLMEGSQKDCLQFFFLKKK